MSDSSPVSDSDYYVSKYKLPVVSFCEEQHHSGKKSFKFSEFKEKFMTVTDLNLKAVLDALVEEKKLQASGGRIITYTLFDASVPSVPEVKKVKVFPTPIFVEAVSHNRPLEEISERKRRKPAKGIENLAAMVNNISDVIVPVEDAVVQKYSLTTYECSSILPILSRAFSANEGVISVEDFKLLLASCSTVDIEIEFESILQYLEDQNKAMVSDGKIYEI